MTGSVHGSPAHKLFLKKIIHLFTCEYIVWVISPPCFPPPLSPPLPPHLTLISFSDAVFTKPCGFPNCAERKSYLPFEMIWFLLSNFYYCDGLGDKVLKKLSSLQIKCS
jgi:hypothetical protein